MLVSSQYLTRVFILFEQDMGIKENLAEVQQAIPHGVKLVAVSKTKPVEAIAEAYAHGQRRFAENRPQELMQKQPLLPADIEWHFIGHLLTNKVKYIAPFVGLIHGVDSLKLLEAINKEAIKNNRVIRCLLQFHIATEDTKFGLSLDEAVDLLNSESFKLMHHVQLCGVMGMATYTSNHQQVKHEFGNLAAIFHQLKQRYFMNEPSFCEISMGMSGDYQLAIEQGSTMVRIGSAIFGNR